MRNRGKFFPPVVHVPPNDSDHTDPPASPGRDQCGLPSPRRLGVLNPPRRPMEPDAGTARPCLGPTLLMHLTFKMSTREKGPPWSLRTPRRPAWTFSARDASIEEGVCQPHSDDGPMRRFSKTDGVLLLLAVLAAAQLLVLALRLTRPEQLPLPWLQAGDTLSGLTVERSGGRTTPLLLGKPTVVLVFGSECPHCLEVARLWRSWIETNGSDWEVLAVSSESFEAARAFADGQDWRVDVGVVEAGSTAGSASALVGRAPWVFVANGAGVILAEGHGNRIAELTAEARTEPVEGGEP